jgi:hypothetical protein
LPVVSISPHQEHSANDILLVLTRSATSRNQDVQCLASKGEKKAPKMQFCDQLVQDFCQGANFKLYSNVAHILGTASKLLYVL